MTMLKVPCVWILMLLAGALAAHEESCCSPELYVSLRKVEGEAICYSPWSNDTAPANLHCDLGYIKFLYSRLISHENGTVEINSGSDFDALDITNTTTCVNNMINLKHNFTQKYVFVCNESRLQEVKINGYLMIVSVLFLLLTVIIYSIFGELRDLLGISYINLCSSLAIGLCIFATIILSAEKGSDQVLCAARGFLAYFFLLVSFFWTSAISIQLLLNTRSPSSVPGTKWKSFKWYALFAWGCPFVITTAMAITNFHPGDHAKPGIGDDSCWFEQIENVQIWYWLYSVLVIVIAANIMMYTYVCYFLCRNTFASSQATLIKYKFTMSLKLFVVMGLFWIFELIQTTDQRSLVIWTIFSVITSLQGVWIFLVMVPFRKRAIRAMHRRGWLACIAGPIDKYLANGDDADDDIVENTFVPISQIPDASLDANGIS